MNNYAKIFIISMIVGIVLSGYLVLTYVSPETEIKIAPQLVKEVKEYKGSHTITYKTTNTTFSRLYLSCYAEPATYEPDTNPNCIVLWSDGKPGVVELSVPKVLLEKIGDVTLYAFFHINEKQLPFQRIYANDSYTVIRVAVPAEVPSISINGITYNTDPPLAKLLLSGGIFGMGIFIATLLAIHFVKWIKFNFQSGRLGKKGSAKIVNILRLTDFEAAEAADSQYNPSPFYR